MALGRTLYNTFFRRTSAFFVTVLVGAVLFERAFDQGGDRLWERMNQGVSETGFSSRITCNYLTHMGRVSGLILRKCRHSVCMYFVFVLFARRNCLLKPLPWFQSNEAAGQLVL